jgi:uncharacterized protein DUF397
MPATWSKSSYSSGNGNCVEWRRCDSATCVEVGIGGYDVQVRDSKDPEGPVLRFSSSEWMAFITGVQAGEFTLSQP